MTSKKTDKNADNESADETADVAPYLSQKTETPDTSESSSMFTPFILTVVLAAAIFVIFYNDEYRNLMASVGFNVEETASSDVASVASQSTNIKLSDSKVATSEPMPPLDGLVVSSTPTPAPVKASVTPPKTTGTSASNTATTTASAAQTASRAPAARPQPGSASNPYAYAPRPAQRYSYPPAYQYEPRRDYYDYDRPYGYDRPAPSQSYEDMLERRQKALKEMEQERAEAYKAYEKRMKEMEQERTEARKAYEERVKARKAARSTN